MGLFSKKKQADYSFGEVWAGLLEERFGSISEIKEIQDENKPKIIILYFDDLPEEGFTTAITAGLSFADHPDWKYSKPELMVVMDSPARDWGFAAGYFASTFFGEKRFCYGDVFKIDVPISPDESDMDSYLVFAPSFLSQEQATFVLPDKTIHLSEMYPLYTEELVLYEELGLKDFWHAPGFDTHKTKRPMMSGI